MRVTGAWVTTGATQAVFAALSGHTALFVGGCVRNDLLGLPVADVDIATDAPPEAVIRAAEAAGLRALPTGLAHGTVTVVSGGVAHEVTTFRRDVATTGRHATVAFTTDVAEDAARRDFTMNALYATAAGAVIDPLGGLPDLRARRVRFVGDAGARIAEDYLRILRFFRFHALYGDPAGGIDAEGLAACAAGADGLAILSAERVGAEMRKLLAAPDPAAAVAAMAATGILARVLPGAEVRALAPFVHLAPTPDWRARLAVLGGEGVVDRLRLSRADARDLATICDMIASPATPGALAYRYGAALATQIIAARAAVFETPLPPEAGAEIAAGAAAVFPLSAVDLMPVFTGSALGDRLRDLENRWIASGFALARDDLLG